MRLIIKQDYDALSRWTANHIIEKINGSNQPVVLGLPTGSSPLRVYKHLIESYNNQQVSFANVVTFNMDEYVNLPEDHPQSYHSFMWNNFFSHIDIKPENVHILNGNAPDLIAECKSYEQRIIESGGIDLFLGGVGVDGHIAFNEPGSSLTSRTRLKTLTTETRVINSRFFGNDLSNVPTQALTVGVATVMDAKEVVVIANGANKARALAQAVEGGVSQMWTISALQMHQNGIIVCDEEATSELRVGTYRYFKDIEIDA
ncbi:MAG: glucosamine-6-phosphate isomerase [Bacteroidetes bacterium]|nr:glucosamine-6-phosphate isomerase [Bacteroidota bacterium]